MNHEKQANKYKEKEELKYRTKNIYIYFDLS